MTPDWQLPPGTDRGLWDYVSSERVAREYDAALARVGYRPDMPEAAVPPIEERAVPAKPARITGWSRG